MENINPCYHEPKVHDHELYNTLNRANLFGLLPMGILGIIFNTCALICLYRPPRITSGVFVYLKAMLLLDHCQLLTTSAVVLVPQFCDSHFLPNHTFYEVCMVERRFIRHILPRLEMTINTMHVWTIAALSAHRYWKISRPVKSRMNDTVYRAQLMLCAMFVVALIFRSPTFLVELRIKWHNKVMITTRPGYTEIMTPYRMIYHSFLDPLLSNVIPFLWMALFSLMTLREVFRSRKFNYKQISTEIGHKAACAAVPIHFRCRLRDPLITNRKFFKGSKFDVLRQKQEYRATCSIVIIIVFYLTLHSVQLYMIFRKWQLILSGNCPSRADYMLSHIGMWLSLSSATVNAFVFIAFTNKLRKYVNSILRKTSRTLSNSSDPPLSPKTTTTVANFNPAENPYNV